MFNPNSKKEFIFDELLEIPKLKLFLEYNDIGNKKYSKTMIITFSISGKYDENFRRKDFSTSEIGTYHVSIKEEK